MCTEICQYLDRQATYKTCHSVNSMLPQPMFWHFVGSGTHESYLALSESVNVSGSRATRLSLKMLNSRSASEFYRSCGDFGVNPEKTGSISGKIAKIFGEYLN